MLRGCLVMLFASGVAIAQDELPKVLDDRLKIELFAEHPQLVTPTGIDVDHLGRVFVIESNTHFPPEGYQGHPTDRILILENTDADPQADKITVFADGLTFTMSIAVQPVWLDLSGGREPPVDGDDPAKPQPGDSCPPLRVFVATRNEILLLTDTDGDHQADDTQRLVHLETAGNYPHNGLAGFAFDALGNMFFGFGENLGADYKIIGSDGTTLSGGGEGGNLYRCKPDGSKLERWATGFWNPHASCFDAFGRLFTVDNDPDSRPPCRLLHIIPGGDYGYRFRNGRKGTHPFTSWNGEIPGTLPMVAGTGEAPSGIVCYENDGFPADYLGTLLVGSWGDHRIDQFVLEPKGASFTSKAKPIIQGGENFRPVGLAVAPDGSLYFSDWVLKDYKLHGKGRVWRVSGKDIKQQKKPANKEGSILSRWNDFEHSLKLNERRTAARNLAQNKDERTDFVKAMREGVNQKGAALNTRSMAEGLWAIALIPAEEEELSFFFLMGIPHSISQDEPNEVTEVFFAILGNDTPQRPLMSVGEVRAELGFLTTAFMYSERPDDKKDVFKVGELFLTAFGISPLTAKSTSLHLQFSDEDAGSLQAFTDRANRLLVDADQFTFAMLVQIISERHFFTLFNQPALLKAVAASETPHPRARLAYFLAARNSYPNIGPFVMAGLQDPDQQIRRAAVQWVGETNFGFFRPRVEALLADPTTTPDLFLACLATLQLLDGKPASEFEKNPPTQYIAAMVQDASRPAALRATALRMLPANAPELDAPLLMELLSSTDASLRLEAVRTLAVSPLPEASGLLLPIAANPQASIEMRAEAMTGLCNGPHDVPLPGEVETFLLKSARGDIGVELSDASQKRGAVETLQLEALRSLRGRATEGSNIRWAINNVGDAAELKEAVEVTLNGKRSSEPLSEINEDRPADIVAGRRVFFHHNGPLCAKCHTVQGRGGQVGPDLTVIARTMDREKLWSSILTPSKEISPHFTTWVIETTNGKAHTGFILEDNRTGQIKLGTPTGEVIVLDEADIETREPSKTSVMPEKLHERMTTQELRDLLAFLETLK